MGQDITGKVIRRRPNLDKGPNNAVDLRVTEAKRFFDLGVGRVLGIRNFDLYLETVPNIPPILAAENERFPYLIFVESRIGLLRLCKLSGIDFDGDDDIFIPWDSRCQESMSPIWIRAQDGRKNKGKKISECRRLFAPDEVGLTALQGISMYIIYPDVVVDIVSSGGNAIDLPGSIYRTSRRSVACLLKKDGRIKLSWRWDTHANPFYGSASRLIV